MLVLQKYIAQSGFCSRRKAEELIKQGRVFINDKLAEPGVKAEEEDEVKIDGKKINLPKEKIYIKMNKPIGYTCTSRRFSAEKNIFSLIGRKERLFVAGRLDKDSRGLILLTNDGDLTQRITHPKFGHEKRYVVKIKKTKIKDKDIENLFRRGVDIGEGDGIVRAKDIKYIGDNKFEIILAEGKKRQIRRMFKAMGLEVEDLIRVSIGRLKLGDLPEKQWRPLKKKEIDELLNC
ncbi:MAG: pseudouridine synthase [Patescibacteria group bacterium]|nr:pseudouridine synthase [Patescibacteria group bacterium]MDD5294343.1 pseudouridine synthase [Patescibacteria group bacterium]MDD5554040.1 pseudouridine synthase [Patescibacteria group bacterium]